MKKLLSFLVLLCCALTLTGQAQALTVALEPPFQAIRTGDTAQLDLNISGLGDFASPSLGAFSLSIAYDPTILAFDSAAFGPYLGDPDLDQGAGFTSLETDIFVDAATPGRVYLDEVSLLFDFELDALQPGSFTLASLTFQGAGVGLSDLTLGDVVLSDAFGFQLGGVNLVHAQVAVEPVPEPGTLLLLGAGVAGLAASRRKLKIQG